MRILFVSREYPPQSHVGGIGTYTREAALLLARAGHEVHVISIAASPSSLVEKEGAEGGPLPGIRVHRLPPRPHPLPPGRFLFFYRHLYRRFLPRYLEACTWARTAAEGALVLHRMQAFDILEYPDTMGEGAFLPPLPGLRKVCRIHSSRWDHGAANAGEAWLLRRLHAAGCRRADTVVSPSRHWAREFGRRLPGRAIAVLPNPFRSQGAGPAPSSPASPPFSALPGPSLPAGGLPGFPPPFGALSRSPLPPGALSQAPFPSGALSRSPAPSLDHFLYVGRIEPRKGVHLLLDALDLLGEEARGITLRLIGAASQEGPEENAYAYRVLERLGRAAQGRPYRVDYRGPLPHSALGEHYDWAGLCLLPSLEENYPYVLLEAASRGCYLLASRCGGIPEIVTDSGTGLLFAPGRVESLAEKMRECRERKDAILSAIRLRKAHFARRHCPRRLTRKMLELYEHGRIDGTGDPLSPD